jgi:acyl-CoA thioester hydrolase
MFRHPIGIVPADIDHMGHVNNAVYLRWVQEAVIGYWEKVAPAEAVASHLWVALKHEITYRRPAFFSTVIRRGEEVVAEVKSCWCCLDSATKRPARLAGDVVRRFLPE